MVGASGPACRNQCNSHIFRPDRTPPKPTATRWSQGIARNFAESTTRSSYGTTAPSSTIGSSSSKHRPSSTSPETRSAASARTGQVNRRGRLLGTVLYSPMPRIRCMWMLSLLPRVPTVGRPTTRHSVCVQGDHAPLERLPGNRSRRPRSNITYESGSV